MFLFFPSNFPFLDPDPQPCLAPLLPTVRAELPCCRLSELSSPAGGYYLIPRSLCLVPVSHFLPVALHHPRLNWQTRDKCGVFVFQTASSVVPVCIPLIYRPVSISLVLLTLFSVSRQSTVHPTAYCSMLMLLLFFVAVLNECTILLCYTGNSVAPWSPFERLKLWAPSCYICSICRLLLFSHSLSKLLTKKIFETLCLFLCICSITFLHSVPC